MENEEQAEEPQEEKLPLYTLETSKVPRIVTNLDKNVFHFVKLPSFLSIESRPYDPQYYEDETDKVIDEEGRARLPLKLANTIRWRQTTDEHGNPKKESNARIVRWSDGSMSLHLGSEVFDVFQQKLMADDHHHVFLRHADGLQGQGVFSTKLSFRPYSINSSAHRKMLLSLSDHDQKLHKIQILPHVGQDPEANRRERIKKEEASLKAAIRREKVRRRMIRRPLATKFNSPHQRSNQNDGKEEDEEGAISLSSIKNKYEKRTISKGRSRACSLNEDISDRAGRDKELDTATSTKDNDDDEDGSDLDYFDRRKAAVMGKKKKVRVIQESDED